MSRHVCWKLPARVLSLLCFCLVRSSRFVFSVAEDVVIPPSPAAEDEGPADENKESTPVSNTNV